MASIIYFRRFIFYMSSSKFIIENLRKGVHIWDDMIGIVQSATTTYQSQLPWAISAAANLSQLNGTIFNPGQIQLSTLTSSSANVNMYGPNYVQFEINDNVVAYYCALISIPTASSSSQRFIVNVGFVDSTSSIANGFYYSYSDNVGSGQYVFECPQASPNNIATGVTPTFGNFDRLELYFTRNSITGYINGAQVFSASITYPAASVFPIFQIIKSVGTTARTLVVDCYGWDQNISTIR
jgi:hypothetical protein